MPSPRWILSVAWPALAGVLWCASSAASGQSLPTPGPPSIPLTAPAGASLSRAGSGISYQYGIEFVTVPGSTLNNQPWAGNGTQFDQAIGRGQVGYDYRIGRYEITTAQWATFMNAAFDRPQSQWLPHLIPPDSGFWGAVPTTPNTPGGRRWRVPVGNEMRPVGQISWRMAAMYTNFLHNDQSTAREAFLNGAYDVGTFGYPPGSDIFTDQITHNPGARFWIPTWDEWLLAAHYDPNRSGPGAGGWWLYSTTSATQPVGGRPAYLGGTGQANFGWEQGGLELTVPLGAYPTVQSPWGLLDTAGGQSEWTESIYQINTGQRFRLADGSTRGGFPGEGIADALFSVGAGYPSISSIDWGFRIAAAVPAPTALPLGLIVSGFALKRNRRPT